MWWGEVMSEQDTEKIDKSILDACIHCGMCLPACPTYLATGRETESPRGRIYLIAQWQEGALDFSPRLAEHIDSCLGCLGCQTACPSLVDYEKILNSARPKLAEMRDPKTRGRMRYVFSKVLPDYPLLRKLGGLLRLWQYTKGRHFLTLAERIFKFPIVERLTNWESFLPAIPKFLPLPRQSWSPGAKKGTVQLFQGCIMDIFYNDVNHCALRLLHKQSQIVEVPQQTCCGALAFHAGENDITVDLAKRNIEFFEKYEGEIIVTSAGCGAMLKGYPELFEKGDQESAQWLARAQKFSGRVKDLSEFLATHEFVESVRNEAKAPGEAIAYHAACHLAHAQKVRKEPELLLKQLAESVNARRKEEDKPPMQLVPLQDAEHCCGSAGIYNLQHQDLSDAILASKVAHLKECGADIVVTSNPGCLLQIETGVRKAGLKMRVLHIAQLLDQAYGK
jgi:glycolate oxidase iron-sulfur subunit